MSYGAYLRLPVSVGDGLAATQARRLKLPGVPRVIVIFHPLQYPLARGLIARHPDAELWYWRWDRYEAAYDAHAAPARAARRPAPGREPARRGQHRRLRRARRPRARGRRRAAARPARRRLVPAPDPSGTVVAVSLGHLGHRTDWALLRAVSERMPELVLLLIGEWHDAECAHDPDYQACRAAPNLVWLGRRSDEEAARLISLRRRRDRPVRALGVQRHRAAVPDPQVREARAAHDRAGPARACGRGSTR